MHCFRTTLLLAGMIGVSFSIGCGGDDDDSSGSTREEVTALRGTVLDTSGAPISGVSVSAGGMTDTTGENGQYDLRVTNGDHVVRFDKTGYVPVVRPVHVVELNPTQRDVAMLALAAAMPLDADEGGTVTGTRGAELSAPAEAFVDSDGEPVTGTVMVHLTPIDPSDAEEMSAASGDFTATSGGMRIALESLGMMDVSVLQGTETLQVADGSELEIRIPVAAGATDPDEEIALWSIDEETGLWVEEGMAMYETETETYVARTTHMSMWNVDKQITATCICGLVNEEGSGPLPGAHIDASGLDYYGTSSATTDENGRFCVAVRKDSEIAVAAYHASGGGQSRNVMSGSEATDVPARIGDARCLDVGEWNVERDVFRSDDNPDNPMDCGDVESPFTSGCGGDFWEAFECYQPSGECTFTLDEESSMIMYANGSRMVIVAEGEDAVSMMYGPDGELCATSRVADDTSDPDADIRVEYTVASTGDVFTYVIPGGESGDIILECPGGEQQTITPQQRQAFEACGGGASSGGNDNMCTIEGGGGIGAICADDDACNEGLTCCMLEGAGGFCLEETQCDMAGGS